MGLPDDHSVPAVLCTVFKEDFDEKGIHCILFIAAILAVAGAQIAISGEYLGGAYYFPRTEELRGGCNFKMDFAL